MKQYLVMAAVAAVVAMAVVYLNNRGSLKFLLPEEPVSGSGVK